MKIVPVKGSGCGALLPSVGLFWVMVNLEQLHLVLLLWHHCVNGHLNRAEQ